MKLCIFSRTPLASSPWELYKALRKYTDIDVSYINKTNRYADGRYFPYHLLLADQNGTARAALRNAEILHVHNYWFPTLDEYREGRKVIAQFHSLPRQLNWAELMDNADICYTIKQPLHIKEYRLPGLPNLIDPDEYRPEPRSSRIKIAFAPTSKAPITHPQSKGYFEVANILRELAEERHVEILWIEKQAYETNLKTKQGAHILIDDVVTGNWHRTSLEGCCFAAAVLNNIKMEPFVQANLKTLKSVLIDLIDNPAKLKEAQDRARFWVLTKWHAIDLVKTYEDVYKGAVQ